MPEERHQQDAQARQRAEELADRAEGSSDPHTSPQEGHPAGAGERSDRDVGGPTAPDSGDGQATGGAPGTREGTPGLEPHR